jgi:hypothetical protein
MPNILASVLIDKAEIILQDETNVRWGQGELLGWLNDGQREAVRIAPEAYVLTDSNVGLAAGTRQNLDALTLTGSPIRLIDVPRNFGGRAMRPVDRKVLDSQNPDWHTETGELLSKHYTFDSRDPKTFYVYPPANGATSVVVVYSASPIDVALTDSIKVDDIYAPALIDYVVYRAMSKDAEYTANSQLAIAHYTAFERSVAGKNPSDAQVEPVPTTRPQD